MFLSVLSKAGYLWQECWQHKAAALQAPFLEDGYDSYVAGGRKHDVVDRCAVRNFIREEVAQALAAAMYIGPRRRSLANSRARHY